MKSAVVVLADGFEEIEAVTPIDLLRRAGVQVTVAGLSGLSPVGARGIAVGCDCTLESAPGGWDVFVLPGGLPGARLLAASPLVDQLISETFGRGALVAAICAAPALVLGSRGYLRGKNFTGYPGIGSDAELEGSRRDEAVVVDGNLVTSQGVGTAVAFALKLVELLLGPDKAEEVAGAVLA